MKNWMNVLKVMLSMIAVVWMTSCSSYSRHQDDANRNGPVDCSDLHVRNADWHFQSRGFHFDVMGTCKKGTRHGNFRFIVDGKEAAVVKYAKDEEVKVKCLVSGVAVPESSLQQCLSGITPKENASEESAGAFGNGSAWDRPIEE